MHYTFGSENRKKTMWPTVTYETLPWKRNVDELMFIPKRRRERITSTYQSAVLPSIAEEDVTLPPALLQQSEELRATLARFDQDQKNRGYNLPALMLRSESSSSSQIEHLTSSIRNVALADVVDDVTQNAKLIASNVQAMRATLSKKGPLSIKFICTLHDILFSEKTAQSLRTEPVWIGGAFYSPHEALFVPPAAHHLETYLKDLLDFSKRQDVPPIIKTALFHAQFETIHPFTDGNGRTGRALLHRLLSENEVLMYATLPISVGLLHNVNAYMAALDAYQEGEIVPIITQILDALELATVLGNTLAQSIDAVLASWKEKTHQRKGASLHKLPFVLIEQPVITVDYLSKSLGLSERGTRNLIEVAAEQGILEQHGNRKTGVFYQAPELIDILEEASSLEAIRRL